MFDLFFLMRRAKVEDSQTVGRCLKKSEMINMIFLLIKLKF